MIVFEKKIIEDQYLQFLIINILLTITKIVEIENFPFQFSSLYMSTNSVRRIRYSGYIHTGRPTIFSQVLFCR